jgi:hypothetical protein
MESQILMMNRRSFLQRAAGGSLAAPAFLRNLISAPRHSTLRLAGFGAGGMAYRTIDGIATHPQVALACVAEVDSARLDQLKKKYGQAKIYEDWRRLLEREHKDLDIACVGTPDHMHAPIAMFAMEMGLHVYVQKPLTHDIFEARRPGCNGAPQEAGQPDGHPAPLHDRVPYCRAPGAERRHRQGKGGALLEREEMGRSGPHARP